MTTRYFSSLIEQSLSRSTEATLSIMGVTNPQLREHLAQQMGADCGKPGSFLASPVFQQMFGWKESNHTMRSLNRPGFPGECFICELRLPDHRFRWKHNKLFLLLPEEYGPAFPAIVDCYTSPPT